jgi:hypothetical protein
MQSAVLDHVRNHARRQRARVSATLSLCTLADVPLACGLLTIGRAECARIRVLLTPFCEQEKL